MRSASWNLLNDMGCDVVKDGALGVGGIGRAFGEKICVEV